MVTGNYLSLDESSKVIMAASNLGWYSQWIWKPKGGSNPDGIWGYIKPSAHDKYLSLEGYGNTGCGVFKQGVQN
jgi:hypothetical protein